MDTNLVQRKTHAELTSVLVLLVKSSAKWLSPLKKPKGRTVRRQRGGFLECPREHLEILWVSSALATVQHSCVGIWKGQALSQVLGELALPLPVWVSQSLRSQDLNLSSINQHKCKVTSHRSQGGEKKKHIQLGLQQC